MVDAAPTVDKVLGSNAAWGDTGIIQGICIYIYIYIYTEIDLGII